MTLKLPQSLFSTAPFFMIRLPIMPVEQFINVRNASSFEQFFLRFYEESGIFQEAVAIASPSLYEMTQKKKYSQQIKSSLLKYFLRMTNRSTPFGLFSFISFGQWDAVVQNTFDSQQISKRIRFDTEGIVRIVGKLCQNLSFKNQAKIQRNPLIAFSGERANLNYFRRRPGESAKKEISIRMSPLVKMIFEIAYYPVNLKTLEEELLKRVPNLDFSKIRQVIDTLINQQLLNFTLASSLLTISPLQDILKICPFEPLSDLNTLLNNYHILKLGKGLNQLSAIDQAIQILLEESEEGNAVSSDKPSLIQVDAFHKANNFTLPVSVQGELSKSASVLWYISRFVSKNNPLYAYHEKFIERYAIQRTVPLLDLLSEERGLGIPPIYKEDNKQPTLSTSESPWDHWLKNKLFTCIRLGEQEIEITDNDLQTFIQEIDLETVPPSLDIYFEICAASKFAVEQGNYKLVLNTMTPQGCSTFGRFFDLLDESYKNKIGQFLEKEEALLDRTRFVESSYLPQHPRGANVATHPSLRKYTLDLGKVENFSDIRLEDLYVGATIDRLYITLKEGQEELFITSGNLLNPTYAPTALRFIRDVSRMRFVSPFPWSWGKLDNAHYLPKVRYGKVYLTPAQWHFDPTLLKNKKTPSEISQFFNEWADFWKMPREVFMGTDDQRLYVDRSHPDFFPLIHQEIKKNSIVHFREKIGQNWIKSEQGTHQAEFVVPLIKKDPYIPSKRADCAFRSFSSYDRFKPLGSGWLFVQIYLGKENENDFLVHHVLPFAQSNIKDGLIKKWFFVRYADPANHLRLRFQGDEQDLHDLFEPLLKKWVHHLFHEHIVGDVKFCTYEREIERYGGVELMNVTETMFYYDSLISLNLIRALKDKKLSLPENIVSSLSMIDLTRGFDLDPFAGSELNLKVLDKLISFFSPDAEMKALSGARQWKDQLPKMIHSLFLHDPKENEHHDIPLLKTIFQQRRTAQADYLEVLKKVKNEGALTVTFGEILHSLIHMHMNRFMGIDREKETKARLYAHYGLSKLKLYLSSVSHLIN